MTKRVLSRREFLGSALSSGAVLVLGAAKLAAGQRVLAAPRSVEAASSAYALIIDTTKCVGCGACRTACHLRNNLPGEASYIHILSYGEGADRRFLPVQCQHCAKPPCASVCPTRATYRREDGVVMINDRLCVGCKYCELACPYQARTFDEKRGVADKCWLCLDFVQEGKNPACVDACVLGARLFGRRDDPAGEVAQLIASGQAKQLHPEFGTRPGVLHYIIA
jgi:Fe-S-cluster-containing dehydrogenase component